MSHRPLYTLIGKGGIGSVEDRMVFWVKIVSGYMLLLVGLLWLLYRAGSVLHTRQEPPPDSRDLPRGLP